jgi:hypothetical protein
MFGYAKYVSLCLLERCTNLFVFVAVRIHWESLYVLKNKSKTLIRFWKKYWIAP